MNAFLLWGVSSVCLLDHSMLEASLLIPCSFLAAFQIEGLQERLKNKDGTIERKSKESQAASSDKRRLESEVAELKDQLDTKERKITVLQRKVCYYAAERGLSLLLQKSSVARVHRKACHCCRESQPLCYGERWLLRRKMSVTILQRKTCHSYWERFVTAAERGLSLWHKES